MHGIGVVRLNPRGAAVAAQHVEYVPKAKPDKIRRQPSGFAGIGNFHTGPFAVEERHDAGHATINRSPDELGVCRNLAYAQLDELAQLRRGYDQGPRPRKRLVNAMSSGEGAVPVGLKFLPAGSPLKVPLLRGVSYR